MIRALVRAALACVLMMSLATVAPAQEKGQPYVVIVGIDKYADPQILPRKFAEADAKALYDLCVSKDHLATPAANIKLLLGTPDKNRPSEEANRANIVAALKWLRTTPAKDDLVILAYLGQGSGIGDRPCYFAEDSTFKERDKNAIPSAYFEQLFENLKSNQSIAFIDVNFRGVQLGKDAPPEPVLSFREFFGNVDDTKTVTPSRVVILPNDGLKPSLDLEKHGILTRVLLDALRGKADAEGYEPDGNITISELVKYVRKELPKLARESAKDEKDKAQIPGILDFHSEDFLVLHNPAAYPKVQERLASFLKTAKDAELSKELTEEGQSLLKSMPKLEAKQRLRKVYQKLADKTLELAGFREERQTILDSTKISERDANQFALTVMRAVKTVRQNYFKDTQNGTMIANAVDGMYKMLHEEVPSSIKDKLKEPKGLKEVDLIKILGEMRQHLGQREDLANGKDITAALNAMFGKMDRHSGYIDPETIEQMQRDITGHFTGIGVQIRRNFGKDMLEVVTPIMNSPAYKAGIQAKDLITTIIREVDSMGKKLDKSETISTKGMTTEEAVKKILGKENTKVRLLIEREGEAKPLEFNLIRGKIEVESVHGHKRGSDDSWNYVVDPENKICYVRLTQFSYNTGRDLENVMKRLKKEVGIKGFILDLRFNPGGLLDQAVRITDLFMDDGLIVTIRPRNGPETSYIGKSDGGYVEFPMVCLVNGGSASASEIVAAALQDHIRAIIIGSRSYGKGSVQTIHPFDTGGRLKLTTATFWRPSGKNLNKTSTQGRDEDEWGVHPSTGFEVKLTKKEENDLQDSQREQEIIRGPTGKTPETRPEFRDRQLDAAVEYLRNQLKTASRNATKKAGS